MKHAVTTTALTTAAVRALQMLGVAGSGRGEQVADRLAEAMRSGILAPGERLPSEALLADQLGVATLTLREALAILRERGFVVTRRGRNGGSFVADVGGDLTGSAALERFSLHDLRELGDLRLAISGTASALAAQRATTFEIDGLARRVECLRAAETANERRRADTELAVEIAAAAQSPRLTREESGLRAELGDLVWQGRTGAEHAAAVAARTDLVAAIRARDTQRARAVAELEVGAETQAILQRRIDLYADDGGRR